MITFVTALYDIGREGAGDGRKFSDYLEWLPATLSLDCNYMIFTEKEVVPYIPKKDNIFIVATELEEIPLYYRKPAIQKILDDQEYLSRIQDPNRVECCLPLYNIVQYSKFSWLIGAIAENPFDSQFFFWIDAGCSRFFNHPMTSFPNPDKMPDRFLIQGNVNTHRISINENYKWRSDCVLVGTFFGGPMTYVAAVGAQTLRFLEEEMLRENMINNEQIALAYTWRRSPELFQVFTQINHQHLPILDSLK